MALAELSRSGFEFLFSGTFFIAPAQRIYFFLVWQTMRVACIFITTSLDLGCWHQVAAGSAAAAGDCCRPGWGCSAAAAAGWARQSGQRLLAAAAAAACSGTSCSSSSRSCAGSTGWTASLGEGAAAVAAGHWLPQPPRRKTCLFGPWAGQRVNLLNAEMNEKEIRFNKKNVCWNRPN